VKIGRVIDTIFENIFGSQFKAVTIYLFYREIKQNYPRIDKFELELPLSIKTTL